jgi:Mg/Co/Ni transporter MgtE
MTSQKLALTLGDIDAQDALRLPARETPATVQIGCLALCSGLITIQNVNVDVTAQVCAAVNALSLTLSGLTGTKLSCVVK